MSETQGDWNWGNVQSAGGGCLVVGEKLYFYVSGRQRTGQFRDGRGSTGLGILRRDGFASLDAGQAGGTLTTDLGAFSGDGMRAGAPLPIFCALRFAKCHRSDIITAFFGAGG